MRTTSKRFSLLLIIRQNFGFVGITETKLFLRSRKYKIWKSSNFQSHFIAKLRSFRLFKLQVFYIEIQVQIFLPQKFPIMNLHYKFQSEFPYTPSSPSTMIIAQQSKEEKTPLTRKLPIIKITSSRNVKNVWILQLFPPFITTEPS